MNDKQTVVPFISLDEAVLRIHRKWERVVEAQQKEHSARVECGSCGVKHEATAGIFLALWRRRIRRLGARCSPQ
jgi:hypothetical protein